MRVRIVTRVEPNKPAGVGQYWERLRSCLNDAGVGCDWVSLKAWQGGAAAGNPGKDVLIVDNQDAGAIQAAYAVIAVQHGCAGEHLARIPSWVAGPPMAEGQKRSAKRPRTVWVACSPWADVHCKKHMGIGADRTIYGCVDTDVFVPSERQRLRDSDKPVVMHHCADTNKGSEIIGGVAQALGSGFEVRRLNVPPGEVADAMRQADIWLCLSASEGLPTVVQEALSCGLLVVGTDVGVLWPYKEGVPAPSRQDGLCGWANPEIGSVVFGWQLRSNAEFVADMVRSAWACRGQLRGREYARQWWGRQVFTQKWLEVIHLATDRFASATQPAARPAPPAQVNCAKPGHPDAIRGRSPV